MLRFLFDSILVCLALDRIGARGREIALSLVIWCLLALFVHAYKRGKQIQREQHETVVREEPADYYTSTTIH